MRIEIALLVATVATMLIGCDGRLTVSPQNIAVLYGADATMTCSTNLSRNLMWRTQYNKSEIFKTVYTGTQLAKEFSSHYRVSSNNEGAVNLVARADEVSARTYSCEEPNHGIAVSAELIVLVSDPVCFDWNERHNVAATEKLPLQLVCRILYFGHWAPIMEWKRISVKKNGVEYASSITEGVSHKSDNSSVESTLTVKAGQSLNGIRYDCITRFTDSNRPTSVTANNIPQYSYTWTHSSGMVPAKGNENDPPVVNLTLVVIVTVALIVIVSGLIIYIVLMKRKKKKVKRENLAMDAISSAPRRTFCEESDYFEIGRGSVIDESRCSGEFYTGLDDQGLAKQNFYAALEAEQACGTSNKNKIQVANRKPDFGMNGKVKI